MPTSSSSEVADSHGFVSHNRTVMAVELEVVVADEE